MSEPVEEEDVFERFIVVRERIDQALELLDLAAIDAWGSDAQLMYRVIDQVGAIRFGYPTRQN